MSTSPNVDLQDLAIRRETDGPGSFAPRRRVVSRVVVPGVLIAGFLSVLAWAARDHFLPRRPVTIVPVHVSLSAVQTAGTPLFNAAGWVEPRPTPIRVAALATGVVEELLVVEDQAVRAGEPIARLVDEDARLALRQAEAVVSLREAEVSEAVAALAAARTNFDVPAHLELPVAQAEAALAAIETELSNLPHQLARAEARFRLAKADLEARRASKGAVSDIAIEQAQSEFDAADAEVTELRRRHPVLTKQQVALSRSRDAAAKLLELKTDERQALAESEARLIGAKSQLAQAEALAAEVQLRLDRMTIFAPVDGRILNLITQPGSQLMIGPAQMENGDSSTVVTMYEPSRLQIRVDVRFEDLPRAGRGQPVEVRSPAVTTPLVGKVLFLTGFANIQKNTLEVKVSVEDPPPVLKPEMLVDVTFLAPKTETTDAEASEQFRLLVPRALVDQNEEGAFVWTADVAEQVARRRRVTLGVVETPQFLEITDGLTAGSRLIASDVDGLEDGERIRVTGENSLFEPDLSRRSTSESASGSSKR